MSALLRVLAAAPSLGGILVAVPGGRVAVSAHWSHAVTVSPATDPAHLDQALPRGERLIAGEYEQISGILSRAQTQGYLLVQAAHSLDESVAARLAQWLDRHHGATPPWIVAAYDPAAGPPPAPLAARLAFHLDANPDLVLPPPPSPPLPTLSSPAPPDVLLDLITRTAAQWGVDDHRAEYFALVATSTRAALADRSPDSDDVDWAIDMVLRPRVTSADRLAQGRAASPPSAEPKDDSAHRRAGQGDLEPELAQAKQAAADLSAQETGEPHHLPDDPDRAAGNTQASPDGQMTPARFSTHPVAPERADRSDLPMLEPALSLRRPHPASGRFGPTVPGRTSYTGARRTGLRGRRLHLIQTLLVAARWQRIRPRLPGRRIRVYPADLRYRRELTRPQASVVILLDASASMWSRALGRVKAVAQDVVESGYRRRARIAVVLLQGERPTLLAPPGRRYSHVKRLLEGVEAGGGTPLASGLEVAGQVVSLERQRGGLVELLVFTDGRASRSGGSVQGAAAGIRELGVGVAVLAVGGRLGTDGGARQLAEWLGAEYRTLDRIVQRSQPGRVGGPIPWP